MKRIGAIDTLRGFALLGILLMNVMSFSMPGAAYSNPAAFGGDDWLNRAVYGVVHLVADQKFMGLFSLLFGASVMLHIQSREKKGQKTAWFHYVRNFWLLIIGTAHAVFIWDGDILTVYALSSFVLYLLRGLSPKWQLVLGLLIFFSPAVVYVGSSVVVAEASPAELAALEAEWQPGETAVSEEIAFYQGDYWSQVISRFGEESDSGGEAVDLYYLSFLVDFFARALGMMLIGMASYSWGIVAAKRSDAFYRRLVVVGCGGGRPLAGVGLWLNQAMGWSATYSPFVGRIPNLLATPLVVFGYVGLIMLWSRTPLWAGLQARLAATGRMALTNYIGQSLLGTFVFYGFGLGLFGSVNRIGQLGVVLLIWLLQLWLSPIWLRHFRYGPLEWAWRSLSHFRLQPLRRAAVAQKVG